MMGIVRAVCVVFGCVPRMDGLQEAGIYPGKNMSRSAGTCTDRSARSRCVFLGTQAPPSRSGLKSCWRRTRV